LFRPLKKDILVLIHLKSFTKINIYIATLSSKFFWEAFPEEDTDGSVGLLVTGFEILCTLKDFEVNCF
jgi:hypothetical protein